MLKVMKLVEKLGTAIISKNGVYSEDKINTFVSGFSNIKSTICFIVVMRVPKASKDLYLSL